MPVASRNFARVVARSEGTVEVDHMDPPRTFGAELLCHGERVCPINFLPRSLALTQANDAAVSDVYGGEEIHYSGATATTGWRFQPLAERLRQAELRLRWVGAGGLSGDHAPARRLGDRRVAPVRPRRS